MRRLWLVMILCGLSGCAVQLSSSISEPSFQTSRLAVDASESTGETDLSWLKAYCLERIQQIAILPTRSERKRGPVIVLNPVHRTERFDQAEHVVTCNLDYYILPVVVEAFDDLDIVHAYNKNVWREYYEAVNASVSAQLVKDRWVTLTLDESATDQPALSLKHEIPQENLTEYLDIYYTNNEEVVFELVVMEQL